MHVILNSESLAEVAVLSEYGGSIKQFFYYLSILLNKTY